MRSAPRTRQAVCWADSLALSARDVGTWPRPHFEDWTVRGEPVIFVESSRVPRTVAELQLRCSTLTTLAHANNRSWKIVHQLVLQVGNLWPEMQVTRVPQLFGVLLLRRLRLALPSPPVLALVAAALRSLGSWRGTGRRGFAVKGAAGRARRDEGGKVTSSVVRP